jgi:hypothetical protein
MEAIQVQKQLSVEKLQGFKHSLKIEKETVSAKPEQNRLCKMFKTRRRQAGFFNHFSTNFIYPALSAIFAYYLIL